MINEQTHNMETPHLVE